MNEYRDYLKQRLEALEKLLNSDLLPTRGLDYHEGQIDVFKELMAMPGVGPPPTTHGRPLYYSGTCPRCGRPMEPKFIHSDGSRVFSNCCNEDLTGTYNQ